MFLVDAGTGIMQGIRTISIPPNFAEKIRDISEKQLQEDINVEQAIDQITEQLSTEQMMKKSTLKYTVK